MSVTGVQASWSLRKRVLSGRFSSQTRRVKLSHMPTSSTSTDADPGQPPPPEDSGLVDIRLCCLIPFQLKFSFPESFAAGRINVEELQRHIGEETWKQTGASAVMDGGRNLH